MFCNARGTKYIDFFNLQAFWCDVPFAAPETGVLDPPMGFRVEILAVKDTRTTGKQALSLPPTRRRRFLFDLSIREAQRDDRSALLSDDNYTPLGEPQQHRYRISALFLVSIWLHLHPTTLVTVQIGYLGIVSNAWVHAWAGDRRPFGVIGFRLCARGSALRRLTLRWAWVETSMN